MSTTVKAKVTEVERRGLKVNILKDKGPISVGFIPRRELSWDESVNATLTIPQVGDEIEARVTHEGKQYIYLSLRQTSQPWKDAEKRYCLDQVVRGEVVGVRNFGAFVQLEPGIHAMIPPAELPLLAHQLPTDVLAVGDQVQGMITLVDVARHKIELSLKKRLYQLCCMADEQRRSELLDVLSSNLSLGQKVDSHSDTSKGTDALKRYWPAIPSPRHILVLDDDNEDCGRIASFLRQALGIPVEGVLNRDEALRKFKLARDYDLVVVDVRLKNARRKPENGSEAAKELLDLVPDLTVVFTSSDPLVDKYYTTIYGRQYPFVAKGKDSTAILECIHDLCAGRWEEVHETRPQIHSDSSTLEHQLGLELIARRTLPETLQVMLKKLRLDTQTSHAAVFELDSTSKTVSLVAVDPPLQEEQQKAILDGLYYSPIQNVVLDEMPINETDVIQRGYRRFRSLFPIVPFRSFFGLPLTVPDLVTRHALFLFDENRREIEATDLSKARQTAMLMQIAIERSMLIDYMRRFELRYTLGQLLGSLVHELDNRLDSLGSNIDALPAVLDRVGAINEPIRRKTEIAEVHKIVSALTQDKTQLEELLDAYSRLVSGDFEAVNVADLLNRVKLQMDTKARDAKTEIHLVIPSSLPTVRAIASRLEQVVINLVLNSIHQIEQQNDTMEQVSCDQRHGSNLATSGQIILQAQYDERNRPDSVKIRVVDTGPGVHYHQQRWIFLLDTSRRRRGRGLGLFISRNLTEMMGGRLYLDDTLLFMGSSFAVELPLATQNGRR